MLRALDGVPELRLRHGKRFTADFGVDLFVLRTVVPEVGRPRTAPVRLRVSLLFFGVRLIAGFFVRRGLRRIIRVNRRFSLCIPRILGERAVVQRSELVVVVHARINQRVHARAELTPGRRVNRVHCLCFRRFDYTSRVV